MRYLIITPPRLGYVTIIFISARLFCTLQVSLRLIPRSDGAGIPPWRAFKVLLESHRSIYIHWTTVNLSLYFVLLSKLWLYHLICFKLYCTM